VLLELTVAEQHFNAVMEVLRDGLTVIESAQQRWRAVNAPHLVALVRAGARFEKDLLVERPDESGSAISTWHDTPIRRS
jgi:hypothetical protein